MANTPNNLSNDSVLSAEHLAQQLNQLASQHNIKTWCLAYSGGVDSQVLLHLLQQTKLHTIAVYIDHGLQDESVEWSKHCAYQCQQFNIPFQTISVNAEPVKGEGPEAAARNARYAALKNIIKQNMCLLTAQHQDDQSETVLLQLLRGGSASGLSAMPDLCEFSAGWHYRPLLMSSQDSILKYAEINNLVWVEDPSNQQQNYSRNYLRHTVIPAIKQRWSSLDKTLSVFAKQQAENALLLDELASIDLQFVFIEKNCIDKMQLKTLDEARIRNVLRYWVKQQEFDIPPRAVLEQIVRQLSTDSHDTQSLVSWGNVEVRHFRDRLYILKKIIHDASLRFSINVEDTLFIPSIEKTLKLEQKTLDEKFQSLRKELLELPLSIRFRQGGERITPAGRKGSHDLKSLFQEADVPAWQRDKVPLLFAGEDLVAVVGYWLADEYLAKDDGFLPVIN